MNRNAIIIISLAAFATSVAAQEQWTMDRCIGYALEHSADVQTRTLALKGATEDKVQSAASFLPTVSGQIGGQFSWGRGIDPETNTYTNITNFSNSEGIYMSWTAFDGGRTLARWRQACVSLRQAKNHLQQARDSKAIEVMQAFVGAVYAEGCHALAQQRLGEVNQELRKARVQEETGTISRPDVALIEAQKAEAEYELMRMEGEQERMKRTLALAMNHEGEMQLSTDEEPAGDTTTLLLGAEALLPAAVAATLDVEQARWQKKVAGSYMYPTLSFNAGISTGYYTTIGSDGEGRPFSQQWRDNMGRYVAATVSFPIFGNLSRITAFKKAKYDLVAATIQRDETLRRLNHEALQAEADYRQGVKEVEALGRKVEADSLAYNLNVRRFDEGLLTVQDLITAARELQDSRLKLLQARLTLVVSRRLELYYKTGEFPNSL